ncbi:hypothetical protein L202_07815 [Cryptococcus amylolentus CBS 6039]|uniref:ATP-dependent DNA helicase II subunit 1 n=2 Tax=Cryptococcus amylolentus TaxID=104669 RepID=A0A1E3HA87_9TREE|nr:hypothetical protein L202_07815 [Cryptococcus amylolentus CBS 6039]ODN73262.1 hypothetical protein L202_07815 [Cryptococcus amylolentus CBS 6039]ODN99072.1 hypothetical protein I350_07227 [Cryptococcus amylolentus CBS 6273]
MSSYVGKGTVPSWDALTKETPDEEADYGDYTYASRDHVLFCIDASATMHKPFPDYKDEQGITVKGKSALHQALEVVMRIQRSKVISGPNDSVALLLYNVDPSVVTESPGNHETGTFAYQSLRTINAEEMKKLVQLMAAAKEEYENQNPKEDSQEPEILGETFRPIAKSEEMNIANVLRACMFLFRDGQVTPGHYKRIFLITDQDTPVGADGNRAPARTAIIDLGGYDVSIDTFFIDHPGHKFNPNVFWNDILQRDYDQIDEDEDPDADGLAKLEEVMNNLVIKYAPKRAQFHVPLKFGGRDGDIVIGITGFSLISEQTKGQPKKVIMSGPVVQEVEQKTGYTSSKTGTLLSANEVASAFEVGDEGKIRNVLERNWFEGSDQEDERQEMLDDVLQEEKERRMREDDEGGDSSDEDKERYKDQAGQYMSQKGKSRTVARTRLQFSPEEVAQLKAVGVDPQIKILGFQSPDNVRLEHSIKHATFKYTGSTRAFAALLKSCLKLNRHAIALCRLRTNWTPFFGLLIPQEEVLGSDGAQEYPPGFHVIPMPFKDDIRGKWPKATDNIPANETQKESMVNIVRRLRFKSGIYNPDAYPNPSLAYHYAQLQAFAFDEDLDPEDPDFVEELDRTRPKVKGQHKTAGAFMEEFNKAVELDERADRAEALAGGKKRGGKKKEDKVINEEDLPNVRGMYLQGQMGKLKVAELNDFAQYYNVPLEGKLKANLIDSISAFLKAEIDGGGAKEGDGKKKARKD